MSFFENAWWKDEGGNLLRNPEGGVDYGGLLSGFGQNLVNNLVPFQKGDDGNLIPREGYSPYNLTNMGITGLRSNMGYVPGRTAMGGPTEFVGGFGDYAANVSQALQGQMMDRQKLLDSILQRDLVKAQIGKYKREARTPTKLTYNQGDKEITVWSKYNPKTGKMEYTQTEASRWEPDTQTEIKQKATKLRSDKEKLDEKLRNKVFMFGGTNVVKEYATRSASFIDHLRKIGQLNTTEGNSLLNKLEAQTIEQFIDENYKNMDKTRRNQIVAAYKDIKQNPYYKDIIGEPKKKATGSTSSSTTSSSTTVKKPKTWMSIFGYGNQ